MTPSLLPAECDRRVGTAGVDRPPGFLPAGADPVQAATLRETASTPGGPTGPSCCASGDEGTTLPAGLTRPAHWPAVTPDVPDNPQQHP